MKTLPSETLNTPSAVPSQRENPVKAIIEKSKYLSLIAVFTLLLTFGLALLWGVAKAVAVWTEIITTSGKSADISVELIKLVDAFLIAVVLYILAASIYKLFIGDPGLPPQMVAHNIPELKSKLSSVVVLVLAVRFAEAMFDQKVDALQTLWMGLATAVVAGVLIAFAYFGHSEDNGH
jgi:uncharacterized membrane protein YqhA